jgi:phosphopentomutase
MKRVILIVLDSVGCGAAPDAALYGDEGSNTIHAVSLSPEFRMENMRRLGLMNIEGADAGEKCESPLGSFGRLQELSAGKDTTTGHWELAGIVSKNPMPTFPDGFPDEIIDEFSRLTGKKILVNKPYSGTKVINDYGDMQRETGGLIVYTSADSVFQVAAHVDSVPIKDLYRYCQIARHMLTGKYGVGRVIARPFTGTSGHYERINDKRHDFSIDPTDRTMLDILKDENFDVLSVGKIIDIFAGRGITDFQRTTGNPDGIEKTIEWMEHDFSGLLFTNLVDTDMIYGHRNDVDGYAGALSYFDSKLPEITGRMRDDDVLMITADHGCDPSTPSTDHSREYVPLVIYGKNVKKGIDLGTVSGMNCVAATILEYLNTSERLDGTVLPIF